MQDWKERSSRKQMAEANRDQALRWYSAREPIILLVLTLLAVVFFAAVSALSAKFHRQQNLLGEKWFWRAVRDREAGHLDRAVGEFQAAELYSRDNFQYQLNLAQTLAAQGRTDEAYSYLVNLRERQPDDGTVNLELARVLARKGDTDQAIRFYHNALYAAWSNQPDEHRRTVRFELIDLYLADNAMSKAQSELIAMASSLPADATLKMRVGNLFLRAQDPDHALTEFRDALKIDRRNAAALAGAGRAAYDLGRYSVARRYLQAAAAENNEDTASAELLKTVALVLDMDPYRRPISASQKARAVIEAFTTAGDRLRACPPVPAPATTIPVKEPEPSLEAQWKQLKPHVTAAGLRRDSELADKAMDLVFSIEQETSTTCGAPTGKDLALLLVSRLHEGNER